MKKITAMLFAALLGVACLTRSAQAVSLSELQVQDANKIVTSAIKDYNDGGLMLLTYVGSSTEAVVTITSFTMTAYAPAGVADTSFGTAGTYTFATTTTDTLGEICSAIDALDDYTCKLTGGKRDDDPKYLFDQTAATGTNDLKTVGGFEVNIDTGGLTEVATVAYKMRLGITPNSGKRVRLLLATTNCNVAGTFKVYGKLAKYEGTNDGVTRNDTTLAYSVVTADDTDKSIGNGTYRVFDFAKDAHVVLACDDGTAAQASGNLISAVWEEW